MTRPGSRALVLALLVAISGLATSGVARAESIWTRGTSFERERRERTVRAVAAVLSGHSDSSDELAVRVALVDLARGQSPPDGLLLVLLFRARRMLGLDPPQGADKLLAALDGPKQSRYVRSLAALERARWSRIEGLRTRALLELDLALSLAWTEETSAEIRLEKGLLLLERGELASAAAVFSSMKDIELDRSQTILWLYALASVHAAAGDAPQARRLIERAQALVAVSATVSGRSVIERAGLLPSDQERLEETRLRFSAPQRDEDHFDAEVERSGAADP